MGTARMAAHALPAVGFEPKTGERAERRVEERRVDERRVEERRVEERRVEERRMEERRRAWRRCWVGDLWGWVRGDEPRKAEDGPAHDDCEAQLDLRVLALVRLCTI